MVVHGFVFCLISGMSCLISYFLYLLMTTDYCENDRYGSANKNEETVIGTQSNLNKSPAHRMALPAKFCNAMQ